MSASVRPPFNCSPQTIVWSRVPSLQRFRLGVLFAYFLCPPPPAPLLLILSSVIAPPPFLFSLLCISAWFHTKNLAAWVCYCFSPLSPFLFSSTRLNFGPLGFFLYIPSSVVSPLRIISCFSLLRHSLSYFSMPCLLLWRLSFLIGVSLCPLSSSACFFSSPFLSSSPSLPLISHLPHPVSAGGDRHQTDCLPASAHWTQLCEGFLDSSFLHLAAVVTIKLTLM